MRKIIADNIITWRDDLAILLILLSSGTAYFYMYNAGVTLVTLLSYAFFYAVKRLKMQSNVYLIVYSLLIPINYVLYSCDMNLVGDIFFLISTFLITSSISFEKFRRVLFNVTIYLSVISIVLELLYLSNAIKPVLYGDGQDGLYGHYLYAYHAFGGGQWGMGTRLYGIFWEPGIYQMVLNICLIFNLDLLDKRVMYPFKTIKIFIVFLTLVLTRSTTGYLTLGVILVGYFFRKSKGSIKGKLIAIIALISFFAVISLSAVIVDKFSEDNGSYVARSNDWIALINVIMDRPFLGCGVKSQLYMNLAAKYGMTGSQSAGILLQTAEFGVMWLFSFYYSLRTEFKRRNIRMPFLFYAIAITFLGVGEPLAYSPLMLIPVLPFKSYSYEETLNNCNTHI